MSLKIIFLVWAKVRFRATGDAINSAILVSIAFEYDKFAHLLQVSAYLYLCDDTTKYNYNSMGSVWGVGRGEGDVHKFG